LVPQRRGFLPRLREAVVERAREELLAAVERPRLQQLLGADDAERVEELGADEVLSTLAAVERQVGHARVVAAGDAGDERRVLVVGMRARVQGAGRRLEAFERLGEPGGAAVVDGAPPGSPRRSN